MALPLQKTQEGFILEIISGHDRGTRFQLLSGEVRIGRGENNDIILNDERCSREHALIKINPNSIMVEDLGSQNGILINGIQSRSGFLTNGSTVKLGSTTLKITGTQQNQSAIQATSSSPQVHVDLGAYVAPKKKQNPKLMFYGIIGLLIIFGAYLANLESSKKPSLNPIANIDSEIESSQKRQDVLLKTQLESGKTSRQYLDAQATYTKGLRDYREGLYKSAMTSFSATLAIYPEHPTARRYLRLSRLKLDERIQFLLQEGNRFMEQNKYQSAKATFKNILILIDDPENKIYQEAREKYNESVLLLRDSF